MPARTQPGREAIAQAAEWAALFDDPPVSADAVAAFERWCGEDSSHRQIFDRMGAAGARFDALDPVAARTVASLMDRKPAIRRIAGGLGCILLLAGIAAMLNESLWFHALSPDYRTAPGEQRAIALADGSQLVADTDTRFDAYAPGAGTRRIRLFQGRLMANVARDPGAPFVVETREGTATALGTRYSVDRAADRSVITVIESRVRLCPTDGTCRTIGAGERAAMTATTVEPLERVDPASAGLWTTGWIEANDQPLPPLLAELARYRAAPVRFDSQALAEMRVTGSYALDDPDTALRSIAAATGLSFRRTHDGSIEISRPSR